MSLFKNSLHILVLVVALSTTLLFGEDWPKYRHDLNNSGANGETTISTSNVTSLRLKWEFQAGASVTAEPAVATVNSTSIVYFGDWNGTFYALNAVTGQKIWSFQIDAISGCTQAAPYSCKVIGSSANVTNGIVYFGAHNGFVYAVNAANGALVWKNQIANPNQNYAVWTSPAVSNGIVYVGLANAGNDAPCVIGDVVALNASTGTRIWTFQTIDETSCSTGTCTGAGVWASPALDTGNNILYVGTGNPGSTCSPSTANATRYPDSILALNMTSGKLVNYFQAIANDTTDSDFGSSPMLWNTFRHSLSPFCGSVLFNWVGEASKNGSVYVLQRGASGLGSEATLALDGNFTASGAVILGGFQTACSADLEPIIITHGQIYLGSTSGGLYEISQPTQNPGTPSMTKTWGVSVSANPIFSAPSYINGVLFVGSNDHNLYAYNASNGAKLFTFTTGGAVESNSSISNGRVYFGSSDGLMRCLSVNGQ